MSEGTARVFTAVTFDAPSIRKVVDVSSRLRACSPSPTASWVPASKLHVTVKFFGSVDARRVPALSESLRDLTDGLPAPRLSGNGLSGFPTPSRAHVLVIDLSDPEAALATLFQQIEASAKDQGFAPETRAFLPHVTLARMHDRVDVRPWANGASLPPLDPLLVTDFVLYRSELSRVGAEYTPLLRVPFAPSKIARPSLAPTMPPPRSRPDLPPEEGWDGD